MRPGYTHYRSERIALHEYTVPEGADIEDMQIVKLANPSPRITAETLAEDRATPTMTLAHWSRFKCNVGTRSEFAAITEQEWHAAKVDDEIPAGETVWAGLDLGWKHDTTALVPLWMRDAEYRLLGDAEIIVPPRNGNMTDPDEIKAAIERVNDRNPIATVVMDMHGGAEIAAWLEDELDCVVVDRSQQNSFKALDYARFMEALRNGWLRHTGDPGLRMHVMNAVAKQLPGGDIVFDRPASTRARTLQPRRVIDALVAAAMVHTAAVGDLEAEPVEVSMWAWE
jgi:phage terminase large subunit-like protein